MARIPGLYRRGNVWWCQVLRERLFEVTDARSDLSGSEVGFKRNGYGAKTGGVELGDKQILSDRIARDVVAMLRERGYRAYEVKDLAVTEGATVSVRAPVRRRHSPCCSPYFSRRPRRLPSGT